jgi:hypothetical protein
MTYTPGFLPTTTNGVPGALDMEPALSTGGWWIGWR